ncbi:MAG: hypothetical protein F6K16_38535 [Symploca sp. SIO2B6]|nr:hypothetical protein [Symploca sp. SIO2B6]
MKKILSNLVFLLSVAIASPGLLSVVIGFLLGCPFFFVAIALGILNSELDDDDEVVY